MEARGVPGVPAEYDAGINRGLGVPSAFYHFAFEAGSEAGLEEKLLDPSTLPVAGVETARKVADPSLPSNLLMQRGKSRDTFVPCPSRRPPCLKVATCVPIIAN
jgi:hypothetical protein